MHKQFSLDSCGNSPGYNSQFPGPSNIRPNVVVFAASMGPNYRLAGQPPIGASFEPSNPNGSSYGSSGHSEMEAGYGSAAHSYMGASYESAGHSYMGASYGSSGHSSGAGYGPTSPVDPRFSLQRQTMVYEASPDYKQTDLPTTLAENPDSQLFFNEQSLVNYS